MKYILVLLLCTITFQSTYIQAENSQNLSNDKSKSSSPKSNIDYYGLEKIEEGKEKTYTDKNEHSKDNVIEKGPVKLVADIFLTEGKTIKFFLEPFIYINKSIKKLLRLDNSEGDSTQNDTDFLPTTGKDTEEKYSGSTEEKFKKALSKITPELKWCGPGNTAESNFDLGELSATDSCCRHHDKCPNNILAGKTEYGLKNNGLFTRSECKCDKDLYNCLKTVNTTISNAIGKTYFNILGPQCFKNVNCATKKKGTCRHHKKSGWEYEWSDNPKY